MRSCTLDRLRGAISFFKSPASRRPSDPAPLAPAVQLLSVNGHVKALYSLLFFLLMDALGAKRDRVPGGFGPLSNISSQGHEPHPFDLTPAISGRFTPERVNPFMLEIQSRTMQLSQLRPTGEQLLADQALNLGPLIECLERAAAALPAATGSWAVKGIAVFVQTLHGSAKVGLQEATEQLRAEEGGQLGGPGGSGGKKKGGPRGVRSARLRAAKFRFAGWQERLQGLYKRLVLEYLPRAEGREEAAWVLSSEEVVSLVRKAGEGLAG